MRRLILYFLLFTTNALFADDEAWQMPLAGMPLDAGVGELNRTNCVDVMLRAFQSNDVVKALIFMPGSTDEFYMFRRARATLTNGSPSLLDAVNALINQTHIRATFHPPLLLLHTDEDTLEASFKIADEPTAGKIRRTPFVPHAIYNDRDWDFLLPTLKKTLKVKFLPGRRNLGSWHFYRHSFAAWNLDGWEGLEAVSLAGKTQFTVRRGTFAFEPDHRIGALPKLDHFPM